MNMVSTYIYLGFRTIATGPKAYNDDGSGSGPGDPVLLGECWFGLHDVYFFNQGYHWIELNEYMNISNST